MSWKSLTLASTLLAGLAVGAQAAPITGQISFSGAVTYASNSTTSFDFGPTAGVTPDTAFGAFAPGFSAGCLSCATFTDFSYQGVGAVSPFRLYTATIGALTTTFTLQAITLSQQTFTAMGRPFINIMGTGVLTLTGFDDTPGVFSLSTQPGSNPRVSFSATAEATPTPVPEPASLALLGAGLLGLGAARRLRRA